MWESVSKGRNLVILFLFQYPQNITDEFGSAKSAETVIVKTIFLNQMFISTVLMTVT